MHMHFKRHLLALYRNREGSPRPFFVDGCHGNTEMHAPAKFHLDAFHGLQV